VKLKAPQQAPGYGILEEEDEHNVSESSSDGSEEVEQDNTMTPPSLSARA
jgi:hypothetical protein